MLWWIGGRVVSDHNNYAHESGKGEYKSHGWRVGGVQDSFQATCTAAVNTKRTFERVMGDTFII